jgi:hypothetical protein
MLRGGERMKKLSIMINTIYSEVLFQSTHRIHHIDTTLKQKTDTDAMGQSLIFGVKISYFEVKISDMKLQSIDDCEF